MRLRPSAGHQTTAIVLPTWPAVNPDPPPAPVPLQSLPTMAFCSPTPSTALAFQGIFLFQQTTSCERLRLPTAEHLRSSPTLVVVVFAASDSIIFSSISATLWPISGQLVAGLCQTPPPTPPCHPPSIVTNGNRSLAAVWVFGRQAPSTRSVLVCSLSLVHVPLSSLSPDQSSSPIQPTKLS